jgi:hypothetical protein
MRKVHVLLAIVACSVMLGAPAPARADIEIILQVGANSEYFSVASFGSNGVFTPGTTVTFHGFTITADTVGKSNGSMSDLETTNLMIQNTGSTTATLKIFTYANNFTLPTGSNLVMTSSAGGNILTGSASVDSMTHQGWINNANPAIDNPAGNGGVPSLVPPKETTGGPQAPMFNGLSFDNGTVTVPFDRTGADYSLMSEAIIVIRGRHGIHFTETLTVAGPLGSAVPEPATMTLALAGLPGLGLGWLWVRRKKK